MRLPILSNAMHTSSSELWSASEGSSPSLVCLLGFFWRLVIDPDLCVCVGGGGGGEGGRSDEIEPPSQSVALTNQYMHIYIYTRAHAKYNNLSGHSVTYQSCCSNVHVSQAEGKASTARPEISSFWHLPCQLDLRGFPLPPLQPSLHSRLL